MASNDLSAALEEIRGRAHAPMHKLRDLGASQRDVSRLLAAVDAVLELHAPRQLYEVAEDVHGKLRCGHDEDYDGDAHFEGDDGVWYCKSRPTVKACASCADEAAADVWAEWPCATYSAVLAALTGEGKA